MAQPASCRPRGRGQTLGDAEPSPLGPNPVTVGRRLVAAAGVAWLAACAPTFGTQPALTGRIYQASTERFVDQTTMLADLAAPTSSFSVSVTTIPTIIDPGPTDARARGHGPPPARRRVRDDPERSSTGRRRVSAKVPRRGRGAWRGARMARFGLAGLVVLSADRTGGSGRRRRDRRGGSLARAKRCRVPSGADDAAARRWCGAPGSTRALRRPWPRA